MKQIAKTIHFSGTIGNLIFYQSRGRTLVRSKGSVTRERVLKSQEYAKTRQYANKLAMASSIASPIYRALPVDVRGRWIFRTLTRDAASLLYNGLTEREVCEILWKKYIQEIEGDKNETNPQAFNPYPCTKERNKTLRKLFLDRWAEQDKDLSEFNMAWKYPKAYDYETVKRVKNPFGFLDYNRKR